MSDYHAFSPLGEPSPGDVPIAQGDGSVMWGPQSGGGGGGEPLSSVLFSDVGTTVPLANQNGSIATPFASLQSAIDALDPTASGMVYLTPGSYGAGLSVVSNTQFFGMAARQSSGSVTIGGMAIDAGVSAWFENLDFTGTIGDNGTVEFLNCLASSVTFSAGGSIGARESAVLSVDGGTGATLDAANCFIGTLTNMGTTGLESCSFNGDITVTGTLTIKNATSFAPGLTLTATTIDIDADSLRLAVFAGVTFAGTVQGFSGGNFTWGRNSGLIVGNFPNVGIGKQNYTGANVGAESQAQVFAPRRGVLCFLVANSGSNFKFTVRVNGVDTALTVTVNNTTVRDTTHFVEVQAGDLISLQAQDGGDPAASGSCLASCVFV